MSRAAPPSIGIGFGILRRCLDMFDRIPLDRRAYEHTMTRRLCDPSFADLNDGLHRLNMYVHIWVAAVLVTHGVGETPGTMSVKSNVLEPFRSNILCVCTFLMLFNILTYVYVPTPVPTLFGLQVQPSAVNSNSSSMALSSRIVVRD